VAKAPGASGGQVEAGGATRSGPPHAVGRDHDRGRWTQGELMTCPGRGPALSLSRGREGAWMEDGHGAQGADWVGPVLRPWPRREWFDQPFGVAHGPDPVEGLTVPSPACGKIAGLSRPRRGGRGVQRSTVVRQGAA